jgi:hypothetical protein
MPKFGPKNSRVPGIVFCPPPGAWRLVAPLVVVLLLFVSLSLSGTGLAQAATTNSGAVPAVLNCGMGKAIVRPKTLTLACADANNLAKELVWSKWATTGAAASGVDTWNTCVPNCAASKKWDSASADFTLNHAVQTSKGWLFERLLVRITGQTPRGVNRTVIYRLAPVAGA